jgi:iron complex outermembrane recepter protein
MRSSVRISPSRAVGCLLFLLASAAWPVSAQTKPESVAPCPTCPAATKPAQSGEPTPSLDVAITVLAPRVDVPLNESPGATTVVSDLTLKSTPRGVGAEEALQMVPGVKVDNQADGERVHLSIRGQGLLTERGIRGVTVLLDGIPLNDPSGFVPDLFDVDWSNVGRIEVFRGAASALYGGASAGGVISLTTKDGGSGSPEGEASIAGGSYDFWKATTSVGGTAGNVNYHLAASANRGDGYRLHTEFNALNVYSKVRWTPSEQTQITGIVSGTHYYNDNAEGLNLAWTDLGQGVKWARQANPDALTYNEYQRTRRFTAGISGKTVLSPTQRLSYVAYVRRSGWKESVPSSVQHRTYTNPGGNLQYQVDTGSGSVKNHFTAGADVSFQAIDDYRLPNLGLAIEGTGRLSDQSIHQRGFGGYLIDRIELSPTWAATLSVRADSIHNELTDNLKVDGVDLSGDASFSRATGRVGLSWNPRRDVGFYASWGQGFLPPATEELANNPDHLGGFNTQLESATSRGEEVGVRGGSHSVSYDVALFHLATDNDFGRYRVSSRPLETFYGNVGTSRRYGVETSLGYYPTANVALRAAYTFSDFVYTNVQFMFDHFSDTVMPNSPRHQVAVDAEYRAGTNWVIGLNAFGQSRQYVDHSNSMSADGFSLVNPRIAYRWSRHGRTAELSLQARNVFGDEYIAFTEPDPDGNSFQPGAEREVFARLVIGFGR